MSNSFSVEDKHDLIVLTPRLKLVAEFLSVLNVATVADVGTDHAKLPIFLIQNNICNKVYASDVAVGPLTSARNNLKCYGISSSDVNVFLSDGLKNIPNDYNAVSITGMGGLLIAEIISAAPFNIPFVLNPMSSVEDLRRFLYLNSWEILDENIAVEDRRYYSVILAEKTGIKSDYSDFDCFFSKSLVNKYNKSEAVNKYIDYTMNKLRRNYNHKLQSRKQSEDYLELKNVIDSCDIIFGKG